MYRQESDRASVIIADTSLDRAPSWWPEELFGSWRLETVGQVVVHVITETACHAGDATRELIDGRTWMALT